MSDLKLDPESLAVLVQKAILDSLTDEKRDEIMAAAIKNLLTVPAKDHYGRPGKVTPLMQAFESAVSIAAQQMVREMVANDEAVQKKILELVSAPIATLAEGNWDGLPEAVGTAVAEWLRDRSRA